MRKENFILKLGEEGIYFEQAILKTDLELPRLDIVLQWASMVAPMFDLIHGKWKIDHIEKPFLSYDDVHAVFMRSGIWGTRNVIICPRSQEYSEFFSYPSTSEIVGDPSYNTTLLDHSKSRIIVVPGLSLDKARELVSQIINTAKGKEIIQKDILPKAVSKSSFIKIPIGVILVLVFLFVLLKFIELVG